MAELHFGFNALTGFLCIAAAGFIFLLVSFFLGDLFDQIDLDIELDVDGGMDEMGWFDSRVVSIFATAFGGIGAIGMLVGQGAIVSSLMGLAGGLVLGSIVLFFGRLLYKQQASSSVSAQQLIGRIADVIVTIRPGGIGQISCRFGEERVEKLARSHDNTEIKAGSKVVIEDVAEDAVIVSANEEISNLYFPAIS